MFSENVQEDRYCYCSAIQWSIIFPYLGILGGASPKTITYRLTLRTFRGGGSFINCGLLSTRWTLEVPSSPYLGGFQMPRQYDLHLLTVLLVEDHDVGVLVFQLQRELRCVPWLHTHPWAIFFWGSQILHDILGFDTIITRYLRYFRFGKKCA